MTTGTKLAVAGVILVGVTAYVAYSAACSSWQYYLTVDECTASPPEVRQDRIRVSGTLVGNSLHVNLDRTETTFLLAGTDKELPVTYAGPVPDHLAEGRDVVVEGHIREGVFRADRVLTRCASKYSSSAQDDPAKERHRDGD